MVRVPPDFIARNLHVIRVLSDYAADIEIAPQPLPQVDDDSMLQVPVGLVGANEHHVLLSLRISRRMLARRHGAMVAVSGFAA
jgi:hypothetical protein